MNKCDDDHGVPSGGFYGGTKVDKKVDMVIDAVRHDLLSRSQLGIKKYGVTLSEGGLSHRAFLQHAYEEALDLANYLKGAIIRLDNDVAMAPVQERSSS